MGRSGTTTTVKGTDGDDPRLVVPDGWLLTKTLIDGGRGSDTLDLSGYAFPGVRVYLTGGYAKSKSYVSEQPYVGTIAEDLPSDPAAVTGTIKNVENLIGTSGHDFLKIQLNSTAPKRIDGGAGNDFIQILGGNGTHVGGTGSDWITSYWQGNTLVGGTYVGGVATGDGERDFFYTGSAPVILDFETLHDQLLFEIPMTSIAAYETARWVPDGASGSSLYVDGVLVVTLAGISPATAETIRFGYVVLAENGIVQGGQGNDILYAHGGTETTRILLDSDSGHDMTSFFEITEDILVFEDVAAVTWSNTMLNGSQALVGTFAGGSITLPGLSTADVANLQVEGVTDAQQVIGTDGMSHWSSNSDGFYYA